MHWGHRCGFYVLPYTAKWRFTRRPVLFRLHVFSCQLSCVCTFTDLPSPLLWPKFTSCSDTYSAFTCENFQLSLNINVQFEILQTCPKAACSGNQGKTFKGFQTGFLASCVLVMSTLITQNSPHPPNSLISGICSEHLLRPAFISSR